MFGDKEKKTAEQRVKETEKALADAKKSGNADEIRTAQDRVDMAKALLNRINSDRPSGDEYRSGPNN